MTMIDREEAIRERAHAIWEGEGRPEGAEARHWEEARRALEAEEGGGDTRPDPAGADFPAADEILTGTEGGGGDIPLETDPAAQGSR